VSAPHIWAVALQRARQLVSSVRQYGWAGNSIVPAQHSVMTVEELLEKFQTTAVARGLRPKSIRWIVCSLRRLARESGAQRVADLTPERLQSWIAECKLKPVSLNSVLRTAAVVFSRRSLQAMGLVGVRNPFKELCVWLRAHGVRDFKPVHYLRKCFGSLAVADHGIFIASKLLGHSDIGLTASTYAGQVDRLPAVRF